MLKIAWKEVYKHPLPDNHRFPMLKYELLPEQLIYEGTISHANLFEPEPLCEKLIISTHLPDYWKKLKSLALTKHEERRTGFPLSAELVLREITIMQGTLQAALFALEYGVAMNIAGGTHHAFTYKGEGFCLLNDIAIAANYLLANQLASKILVVDLDVHQGNGTAEIFAHHDQVFTFSMHGEKNYPMHKEQSDLDITLSDKTGDDEYLSILSNKLPELIDMVEPDFIFFQSGVDVLAGDQLGRLQMSIKGCKERDRLVFHYARKNHIPVCASMGGGYSTNIRDIVEAHANTYRLAQEMYF